MKIKIKKDDVVTVIAGKYAGKSGKVLKVFRDAGKIIVEKINFVKRHTKPSQTVQQGGIIEKEAPIGISKVMLICNKCGKTTRVKIGKLPDGKLTRICKKCSEMIDAK